MILTNKTNLPQALYDAIKNDDYDAGESDISVTSVIAPPRLVALRRKFNDVLEEDASDRIWSLQGQIIHSILERSNTVDLVEKRFYTMSRGWKIGGKFDTVILDSLTLSDWKYSTVWKFKGNRVPIEFEQQLNLLRLILVDNGLPIEALQVVALLRDWSKPESYRDRDYPQAQSLTLPVNKWDIDAARSYLDERVRLHQEARSIVDAGAEPPLCTEEERWMRPTKYAAMKVGASRATKVFDSLAEANAFALSKGLVVETREGENIRCAMYCPVASKCSFGRIILEENSLEGL